MRKIAFTLLSCFSFYCFSVMFAPQSFGQTINPASGCGSIITSANSVTQLSSSYIKEYSVSGASMNMFGVAWDDGAGTVQFAIGDETTVLPPAAAIDVPAGYATVSHPCIIMGSENSGSPFLWLALAYVATSSTGASDLFMDIYPVSNSYMSGLSYTSGFGAPSKQIQITSSGTVSTTAQPRGDVINELTPPGGPGSLHSSWFTLTWLDNGVVHAMSDAFRDVYSHETTHMFMAKYIATTAPVIVAYPDIAGIQRYNGISTDRIALITYMDFNYHIYYQEWNITNSTLGAASIVAGNGKEPRIDAVDLYTMNSTASIPRYSITFRDGNDAIYQYNDKTATSTQLITRFSYPYYFVSSPTTVFGPGNSYTTIFTVSNGDDIYAKQMSNATGLPTSPDYQVVNCALAPTQVSPSLSQLDNTSTDPESVFVCGYDNTGKNIWYKTSGDPLNFKYSDESVGNAQGSDDNWAIFPNPAENEITLAGAKNGKEYNYNINEVTGRMLLSGKTTGAGSTIAIGTLPSGIYYLHIAEGSHTIKTILLQKR